MRHDFTEDLESFLKRINDESYKIKISPGQIEWAKIPWAGIRAETITSNFSIGLYIVYRFNYELNGVYLSLNQGNTGFTSRSKWKILINRANELSANLSHIPNEFHINYPREDVKEINPDDTSIISKFYKKEEITDELLEKDLKELLLIYNELIPIYKNIVDNEDKEENNSEDINTLNSYSKEDFLNDVLFLDKDYDNLKNLLKRKKNIILQGAPGVGKTYIAKRLAYSLIGEKDEDKIEFIQFHQSYSYEDFIQGYKPTEKGFELKNGVFYNFCKKASNDPDNNYYFIIDEINRGNISKILGELMMLIEEDKRGKDFAISLTYNESKFYVPENLFIIGMMNTADRSLAMIDYALRRRFVFYTINPLFDTRDSNQNIFKNHLIEKGISETLANNIVEKFIDLNKKIIEDEDLGHGFRIGHSYFLSKGDYTQKWYESIIKYEIGPILKEYWFDDLDKANEEIDNLLEL